MTLPKIKQKAGMPLQPDLFEVTPQESISGALQSPEAREDKREASEPNFELTPFEAKPVGRRQGEHSPQMIRRDFDLFRKGASYKTVAASLHVSIYTARDWMHQYRNGNFEERVEDDRLQTSRYDASVIERVLRLRSVEGRSYNEIAALTGVSRATVRKWLARSEAHKNEPTMPLAVQVAQDTHGAGNAVVSGSVTDLPKSDEEEKESS